MLVIHYRLEKSESTKKLSSSYTYTFCVGYVLVSLDKYYAFFLATAYVKRRKKGFCHKCPHTVLGLQNTFEITFSAVLAAIPLL